MRILITGWPKTGKTTLARELQPAVAILAGVSRPPVDSTDSAMALGWSECSAEVATWFDRPGPWIIEGVAVPRALRKWRAAHPDQPPPADRLIVLSHPLKDLSPGQKSMGKGLDTVMSGLLEWVAPIVMAPERDTVVQLTKGVDDA